MNTAEEQVFEEEIQQVNMAGEEEEEEEDEIDFSRIYNELYSGTQRIKTR